jgi:hypothetical protein
MDGKRCVADSDCISDECTDGFCTSCFDGIHNGLESDLDCGSPMCLPREGALNGIMFDGAEAAAPRDSLAGASGLCNDGATCKSNANCVSGLCIHFLCVSCDNNVRDGDETGIDCGGPTCARRCE